MRSLFPLLPSTTLLKTPRLLFRLYNSEEKAKRLYPVGIYDYKKIKEGNFFHWDRTRFVKEFYEDGESVLLLRPRRWAKSTTLSMTKYYFDAHQPELAQKLFDGTEIEKEKEFVSRTRGQYPVIYLSFGHCRGDTWEEMRLLIQQVISRAYDDHSYLEAGDFLDYAERRKFKKIRLQDPSVLYQTALYDLTKLLYRKHREKGVIVLVDEYDVPINEAYLSGYYNSARRYLTSTFTDGLKQNPYIKKSLLTGVLRVAKSGYLTGLNNLSVYSLLDKSYAEIYGVKEQELKEALEYEGLADKMDEVRRYYNGYTTATSSNLYNPWSIVNYLKQKQLEPYWVQTGSIDFIAKAIWSSPLVLRENILTLLNRKNLVVPFEKNINYKALDSPRALWSLLYFAGYLTGELVDQENLKVRTPNEEVNHELSVLWRLIIEEKGFSVPYTELISAITSGNEKVCETQLRTLALNLFRTHDLARAPEAWYHGFLLSMLFPLNVEGYKIQSNPEAGSGRADIVLHSPVGKPDVIIELKRPPVQKKIKSKEDLYPYAEAGLEQMIKNEYGRIFSASANKTVILCSIAFKKKFVAVRMKEEKREAIEPTQKQPTQPTQKQPTQPTQKQPTQPTQKQPTQPTQKQPTQKQPTQPTQKQPTQPTQPTQKQPTQPNRKQKGR